MAVIEGVEGVEGVEVLEVRAGLKMPPQSQL
jgi:hypothetical protein